MPPPISSAEPQAPPELLVTDYIPRPLSRRDFFRRAGLGGGFLLAQFHGLRLRAQQLPSVRTAAAPCLLHASADFAPFIAAFLKQVPPGHDAFVAEPFASEIEGVLTAWASGLMASSASLTAVAEVLAPQLVATPFTAPVTKPLLTGPSLFTERLSWPDPANVSGKQLEADLHAWLAPIGRLRTAEFQLEEALVSRQDPLELETEILYDLVGKAGDRVEERTGSWQILWRRESSGWKVIRWLARDENRCYLIGPAFEDITDVCLMGVASADQLRHGIYYWQTILDGASGVDVYGNNGISAGDYDGDGMDDFYVCQPAGLPNRLYRNRGDGTFEDATEKAGVGILDATSSALFVDLNNSGHQDLIVVRTSGPLLFRNRGDGTFELMTDAFQFAQAPQGTFTAVAAADYDRDGRLDLYFCLYSYYQGLSEYQFPQPYYDARNGPPNFLLRNRGNYLFEDVTKAAGLSQNNDRFSFACAWNDFDQDGWPDLYVVNDFGRKNLYRSRGDGTFEDIAEASGVDDPGAGMSVCWFDYDNDGQDDLYVANMWSAAGRRITAQPQFLPSDSEAVRSVYRKHASGNSVFKRIAGTTRFEDRTDPSGTRMGRWSWGSDAIDPLHTGFPGIYVSNGFISGPRRSNLSSFFWRQIVARSDQAGATSQDYANAWSAINEFIRSDESWSGYERNNVYLNNGDGSFTEAGGVLGLDCIEDSRSFALADIDGDGRVEILLKNRSAPQLRILKNYIEPLPSSIRFTLTGTKSNRDAIGAVVELQTTAGRRRDTVRAGSGFLSQHSKSLTFGLGAQEQLISATVRWPMGNVQRLERLPLNHDVAVTEGEPKPILKSFRPVARQKPAPSANVSDAVSETLPESFATWLVEPIRPPAFSLKKFDGTALTIEAGIGNPQLLVFTQSGCNGDQKLIGSLKREVLAWKKDNLRLVTLLVDSTAKASDVPSSSLPGESAVADESVGGVYDIFYRYLFGRRRNLPLPSAFLLDAEGDVIRVYSGISDASSVLADLRAAPADAAGRLRTALPFHGKYLGKGLHHNYFTYGVAYLQYGYSEQARIAFEQAIERTPSYAPAYYNLGLIHLNRGESEKAHALLEKAVSFDPRNADAWNNLGVTWGNQGDYKQAQESFEKALAIQPAHILAIQNLVKLYNFQNKFAESEALLRKAVGLAPGEAELHIGLAMLLFQQDRVPDAIQQFRLATAANPSNVEAHNGLGVGLMKQGENAKAMEQFQECLRLDPDFDRPYLNLAVLYIDMGQSAKARTLLANFLQSHPENDEIRSALKEIGQ